MPGYFGVGSPANRTGRGLSSELWNFGPYGAANLDRYLMGDMNVGYGFMDDFLTLPTGMWTTTQATAGTFALGDAKYGVALADSGSTTATQGIQAQRGGANGETFAAVARTSIWMEARLKGVTISTGPEFFFGLAVTDTSIIASSALSAQAIGFKSVTDDNVLLATCKDGSSETTAASIHTLVNDTYVKLGFRVDDTGTVTFFVNGVKVGVITANIPTTELRPSLVCQSSGTVQPVTHYDWIAGFCNDTLLGSAS